MSTIEDEVCDVVKEYLGVTEVNQEHHLVDDLGADSLDVMNLRLDLENAFGVSIEDEEIDKIKTVADITDLMQSKL